MLKEQEKEFYHVYRMGRRTAQPDLKLAFSYSLLFFQLLKVILKGERFFLVCFSFKKIPFQMHGDFIKLC